MNLKQFLAAALMFCSAGAWAQTDVTSTYLTNADFSSSTPIDSNLKGYGKDGSPYGFQSVDGWTFEVLSADNSNSSYPNSGMGGAVFAYGSSYQLQGNNKAAPATNPNGEASGNCLGFFAVWGCGGYYYQDVTFPAGKYTITVPMYSQSGTQANTTYTGFFPTSGTNRTVAVNPTVGQWVTQTVTFTLTAETAGQIRVGYQSTGSGSGANPHLFIDCVKIEYTVQVVRDVLESALTAANNANASLGTLDDAIATAQAVYDDDDATQDEVNAAAATLNAAVELAMSAAGDVSFLIPNLGFEDCTVTTTNAAAGGSAAPVDIAGEWTQTGSASWSSSAVVEYGGTGQVNGVSAPEADNAGNTGKTLGVSVGWGGTVTYKSKAATLPAGVYTLKVNAYNAFADAQQFTSKFGFVPTSGTASLSSKNSFASSTWVTDEVTFTLNEATEGVIQVGGTAVGGGSGSNAKVFFDNITIGYQSFLAGAKEAYDNAVAAAETAKTENPNVTGDELTALNAELDKTEPTTIEGYNTAAEAINNAKDALVAAAPSYNAFVTAKSSATPDLAYAADSKKTALNNAKAVAAPTTKAEAETKTAAIVTALRAYYESHALAEKVDGAVNCADAIAGADPDTNSGWTGGIGTDNRDWEKYTDAAGNLSGRYYDGGWSTSAGVNINMSRSIEIPAGKYLLTVTARGSAALTDYTLSVGENAVNLPKNGSDEVLGVFGHGWDDVSLEFESDGNPVTLTIAAASTEYQQWISFNRFRLIRLELNNDVYAGTTEYTALNNAIEAAEANTLGFEDGQYAPYNNVVALEALVAAKAIDQEAELTNFKTDVEAATAALTGVTWTANDGDVDAIYNGTFAETGTGNNPKGWSRSNNGWGQQITGLSAEANGVNEGTATAWYYNTNGAWQYGNEGVYTMPLASNQTYELTFKYRKNGNDWQNWMKASVVNDDNEGLTVAQFTGADNGTIFVTAKAYFTTGAAGDYILSIEQNGNAHLTDVSLVKAASAELALSETDAYEALDRTYYETIKMTRNVVANQNAVCLPFDLTAEQVKAAFGENAQVYTFEDVPDGENSTINFNTKASNTIEANVPVIVGGATACTEQTFKGVILKAGDAKVEGTNFDFVGNYAGTVKVAANDYFLSGGKLYKSKGETNLKSFRAFIQNKSNTQGEVKMFIDGLETGIEAIDNGQMTMDNEVIYNVAGQRVNKAQKGIYIVNGKKVVVK